MMPSFSGACLIFPLWSASLATFPTIPVTMAASSSPSSSEAEGLSSSENNIDGNLFDGGYSLFSKSTRIINGYEAADDRFPYSVSLQDSAGHFCGGSLVALDVVLTAAHCLGDNFSVRWGGDDVDEGEVIEVREATGHPDYDSGSDQFDFALLFLENPVSDSNAELVRVNSNAAVPSVGSTTVTMGWGDMDEGDGTELPDKLMAVDLRVISNDECEQAKEGGDTYSGWIYDSMLCTFTDGKDACQGDSGGPLVVKGNSAGEDVQVGVVSWGVGCAYLPGVFSRVSVAHEWIQRSVCEEGGSDHPPRDLCGAATAEPTDKPTNKPTTKMPTKNPTRNPTRQPTLDPTRNPTRSPTRYPTNFPTKNPTRNPTRNPTKNPTRQPTTSPTKYPTKNPTVSPTDAPTSSPTTASPTTSPTEQPTDSPSTSTAPTSSPSSSPSSSAMPSLRPSNVPSTTSWPTDVPSGSPTASAIPTEMPSISSIPTVTSSDSPTVSAFPTNSIMPSVLPSARPSSAPSISSSPSSKPSQTPSFRPSNAPSQSSGPTSSSGPTASGMPSTQPSAEQAKRGIIAGNTLLISDPSAILEGEVRSGDVVTDESSSGTVFGGCRFAVTTLLSCVVSAWLVLL